MRPEDRIRATARMFANAYVEPPTWWGAIEHGRRHHGTDAQRAAEWGRMAAQGVKKGVADMLFQRPGLSLWVEFKSHKNVQTSAQRQFEAAQAVIGNGYIVARTITHLGGALAEAGFPLGLGWQLAAMRYDAKLEVAPKPKRRGKPPADRPSPAKIARGNRMAMVGVR
jgi:hypothetical protein